MKIKNVNKLHIHNHNFNVCEGKPLNFRRSNVVSEHNKHRSANTPACVSAREQNVYVIRVQMVNTKHRYRCFTI